ncbi:MAG: hypothetical protein ACM3N0_01725 [Chloroflexota bacterium]
MNRSQFEHVISAAADVSGPPEAMLVSMEADVYPLHCPEKAIEIESSLGDGSAKCAAGRKRDWEFARDALAANLVEIDKLLGLVDDLPVPASDREHIRAMLA